MRRICFFILFTAQAVNAQNFNPICGGYYSGIHAYKVNPALTAYTPYKWHINLIGAWVNANNNYLTVNTPYSLYKLINPKNIPNQYKNENGNPYWSDSWLRERLNGNPKHLNVASQIYGPSFTFKFKKVWHIGMFTEGNAQARLTGVGENIAHAAYLQFDSAKNAFSLFDKTPGNNTNTLHRTTFSANTNANIGINISREFPLEFNQKLFVGASVKRAWGFGGMYFGMNSLTAKINGDILTLSPMNIICYDYTNSIGKGWGTDLGIAYLYHKPEHRQPGGYKKAHPKYLYKLGFAIMDIGSIKYSDINMYSVINSSSSTWSSKEGDRILQNNTDPQTIFRELLNTIPNYKSSTTDLRIGLPTRISLSADYQYGKYVFVQAQIQQSMRSRYSKHLRYQSFAMIAPRYEREWWEIGVPLFLEYDYRSFRAGLNARIGPLYFGTNSLFSFIDTRHVRDVDFFIGIAFGNIPGKFKDRQAKEKEAQDKKRKKDKCAEF